MPPSRDGSLHTLPRLYHICQVRIRSLVILDAKSPFEGESDNFIP